MKLGIIISLLLVLILALIGFVAWRGFPDSPTSATSSSKLQVARLPADLPPLFTPDKPEADAKEAYQALLSFYLKNTDELRSKTPATGTVIQLTHLLREAMRAGKLTAPFLDDQMPMVLGSDIVPAFGDALEVIPTAALTYAAKLHQQGDDAAALEIGRSVFALGQRLWESSNRWYTRRQGLAIMQGSGSSIYEWSTPEPGLDEKVAAWAEPLEKITPAWDAKIKLIRTVRPHPGDLVNLARNEQDPSLRAEAVLHLGVAKYIPRGRGNQRVINLAIAHAKSDSDPLVVKAAAAADALTLEEYRKLK